MEKARSFRRGLKLGEACAAAGQIEGRRRTGGRRDRGTERAAQVSEGRGGKVDQGVTVAWFEKTRRHRAGHEIVFCQLFNFCDSMFWVFWRRRSTTGYMEEHSGRKSAYLYRVLIVFSFGSEVR